MSGVFSSKKKKKKKLILSCVEKGGYQTFYRNRTLSLSPSLSSMKCTIPRLTLTPNITLLLSMNSMFDLLIFENSLFVVSSLFVLKL